MFLFLKSSIAKFDYKKKMIDEFFFWNWNKIVYNFYRLWLKVSPKAQHV